MISTEQEARAAVAKVGPDASGVVHWFSCSPIIGLHEFCSASITYASRIYSVQGKPRKASQLNKIATEWAAARGAAK